jgi:methylated-DNA-[protein]-cysteine S-methyltransferase
MIMNSIGASSTIPTSPHTQKTTHVSPRMTQLISTTYESPVGALTLVAREAGLRAVIWPDSSLDRVGLAGTTLTHGDATVLAATADQLDEYFDGSRTAFDLPLDLQGTPFQVAAWQALAGIPYGETRTYSEQAAVIGRPTAVRAIGAANGRNPVSIVLPCHRVIGSNGSLTGFGGGLEVKAALLELERAGGKGTPGRS